MQAPVNPMKTNRKLWKYILLSIVTFGIYHIVMFSSISTDLNIIASRYDGKKTKHYCLIYFLFSWLTLGIAPIVWFHKLSSRIGDELKRRNIDYKFGAGTFWGWKFVGIFTIVGPFIYFAKLFRAMNHLAGSYNIYG